MAPADDTEAPEYDDNEKVVADVTARRRRRRRRRRPSPPLTLLTITATEAAWPTDGAPADEAEAPEHEAEAPEHEDIEEETANGTAGGKRALPRAADDKDKPDS